MPASSDLLAAFTRARRRAQTHMGQSDRFGLSWAEETVTDILLLAASPQVTAVPFTRRQEGGERGTGADWLWWWIGDGGTSFGALVQAKRLKQDAAETWRIDFGYNRGQQRANLLATAEALQVAPVYAVYFGTPKYRQPVPCDRSPHPTAFARCKRCARKTVSLLPAVIASSIGGVGDDAIEAYARAVPIEDLVDPAATIPDALVLSTLAIDAELSDLLHQQQTGPRTVAKALIEQACRVRFGQFSAATAEMSDTVSEDFVFPALPTDQGHMSEPYFPNILRGLRNSPPGYVLQLLTRDRPQGEIDAPAQLGDVDIAGVVLVDQRG